MDLVSIFLLIIVVVAFSIVGYYFINDYLNYKTDAAKDLDTERKDRLGNVRYVVDSVNTVNTDIFHTFNSNVIRQNEKVAASTSMTSNLSVGLDSLFKLNTSGASFIPFSSLPGSVPVTDLQLIKHVTAISGMTMKDLSSNNQFTMCSSGPNPRCIQFPDANGNTLLTNIHSDKNIVLDGPTSMYNPLTMKYGADGPSSKFEIDNNGKLSVTATNMLLKDPSSQNENITDDFPSSFEIQGNLGSGNNLFKAGVAGDASRSMVVTATGDIILGGKHVIASMPSNYVQGGTDGIVIVPNAINNGNPEGTLYIAGNVRVSGSVTGNLGMNNLVSQTTSGAAVDPPVTP